VVKRSNRERILQHAKANMALGMAAAVVSLILSLFGIAHAQEIEVLQIRPNFYLIAGAGGNVTVQFGADGVMLVNAGSQEASGEVLAAIRKLTQESILYIINTSADADFVGGNGKLSEAGRNITTVPVYASAGRLSVTGSNVDVARILAHQNVLLRMSAPTGQAAPFSSDKWPNESFNGRRKYLFFNDEGVEILHLTNAHTDGDSVVFFRRSDVVVAGDILDTTRFPVVDVSRGGSIQGEINALNRLLELAIPAGPFLGEPEHGNPTAPLPYGTAVVSGHGRILDQIDVLNYRNMVVVITDTIQDMINRKMTLEEIKAAAPAKAYETRYGATSGSWTTNDFVEAVYKSLTNGKTNAK
jgi:glyoxylase-like metal-dependent hydrolase (beta-lactamase superfamily II)